VLIGKCICQHGNQTSYMLHYSAEHLQHLLRVGDTKSVSCSTYVVGFMYRVCFGRCSLSVFGQLEWRNSNVEGYFYGYRFKSQKVEHTSTIRSMGIGKDSMLGVIHLCAMDHISYVI